jgi:hypothetical protein
LIEIQAHVGDIADPHRDEELNSARELRIVGPAR